MDFEVGTRLGRYEITAPLGAGGMGEVYRARDTDLDRDVAIKMIPQLLSGSQERLARFEREARAIARLNSPNIVSIYSIEQSDLGRFLVMELVEGRTLRDCIPRGGLDPGRFLKWSIAIVDAVACVHAEGIDHRDLKPSNILVTPADTIKILDFGLAKLHQRSDHLEASIGQELLTGQHSIGTVPYLSPEQALGNKTDVRSDVFSLGIVLYEMAAGVRPFLGESGPEIVASIIAGPFEQLSTHRGDLPEELEGVISRCLQKEPRSRYQSASGLAHDLKRISHAMDAAETRDIQSETIQRKLEEASPRGCASSATAILGATILLAALFL